MTSSQADIAFPKVADQATAEWFTAILRSSGHLPPENAVVDLTSEPVGNGLVCESVRFALRYAQPAETAPDSVVCKFPSDDPDCRTAGVSEMVYKRELEFYTGLEDIVAVRAPRSIHVAHGATDDDFVLVLEDLSPAVGGDQVVGCSVKQAEAVIDAAAALHGPRWGDTSLDNADWNVRPMWIPQIRDNYAAVFATFRDAFADRNEEHDFLIGDWFAPAIGRWFEEQPLPWTITHGDYRLDNMLFEIKGGAEPVGILDWQTIMPGPGAADVAYFLGGCLPTEVRREAETALLERYHAALIGHGVRDYGFDQLLHDYRYNTFMGYFMCTYAAMLVPRTERGDHMFSVWLQRTAAQITDHDAVSLLPKP